jgi:hypothetical protein
MATSPQYSWPEPDNSSLVKNGAQDIRALGDAIDTSVWNIGFGQAGKNKIINGDFQVWQRGTTLTYTSSGLNYLPDRFFSWTIGTCNVTVSQQAFTAGTAPVAGYEGQYFMRNAVTSLSGQTIQAVGQRIEDVRTFAGQSATFSFWAKADSARTYTTRFIQNFGSGGSSEVQTSGGSHSVTTSWQRFSVSVTIPSVSGKTIGTSSYLQPLLEGPANTANTLDTWGWQLEYGSKATPFQTATGNQGELALCQRYFYKMVEGNNQNLGIASMFTATQMNGSVFFPVTMRTAPTLVAASGTDYYELERAGSSDLFNSLTIFFASPSGALIYNSSEILGTAGVAGNISTNNASASVAFSAEL